jgi:cytochrome c peroxidase
MKPFRTLLAILLLGAAGAALADEALLLLATELFGRLRAPGSPATAEQALGRALFWDERISLDGKTSCGSCHAAADWGADRRRFAIDARGKPNSRHSQTVFNSMGQPGLRWLADRRTGADQAEGSLTGSLGFPSKDAALAKLREADYLRAFQAAYPGEAEPLTTANYGKALAAYQATLVTPAPFDRFLAGEQGALSEQQKRGLATFVSAGCGGCHNGPLLGGRSLHRFGVVKDYWTETASTKIDPGLFAVTKKEEDRHIFRVAMLRNVAKTAPYFHDGSVETLERAVRVMASVQLGRTLGDAQTADIVAFLESLTGEVPAHYAPPERR